MLTTNALIDGRYRLDERLATGGMGDVWRATDTLLGRTVAVKTMLPALLSDPLFGTRFRSEARMLAALHHPGVVRLYDYGEGDGPNGGHIAYLVMEYVEGEPLSDVLSGDNRLSPQETLAIVARAADALHAAHSAGIVHRDVKPANLLLPADGSVMLVDFGLALSTAANPRITISHAFVGTATYMAPEQASGKDVSPATDVYALGAVAYHCLAGHPPFPGANPMEVVIQHMNDEPPGLPADVPAAVRDLVARALAKDPADRYPTAAALATAARAIAGTPSAEEPSMVLAARAGPAGAPGQAVASAGNAAVPSPRPAAPAHPPVPPKPATRRRGRQPSTPAMAGTVMVTLLLLSGLITFLVLSNRDSGRDDNLPAGNLPPSQSSAPVERTRPNQHGDGAAVDGTKPAQTGGGATTDGEPTPVRSSRPPAASPGTPRPQPTATGEPGLRLPILPSLLPPLPDLLPIL